jgi:DNA-binding XRE family transcriptional regulator
VVCLTSFSLQHVQARHKSILFFVVMNERQFLEELGVKIRSARLNHPLTQVELAGRCDMEKSSVSRIESGKANPTVRSLFKIATALNAPVSGFFGKE